MGLEATTADQILDASPDGKALITADVETQRTLLGLPSIVVGGPEVSVANSVPVFSDTSGRTLAASGVTIDGETVSTGNWTLQHTSEFYGANQLMHSSGSGIRASDTGATEYLYLFAGGSQLAGLMERPGTNQFAVHNDVALGWATNGADYYDTAFKRVSAGVAGLYEAGGSTPGTLQVNALTLTNSIGNAVTTSIHPAAGTVAVNMGSNEPYNIFGTGGGNWHTSFHSNGISVGRSRSIGAYYKGYWLGSSDETSHGDVGVMNPAAGVAAIVTERSLVGSTLPLGTLQVATVDDPYAALTLGNATYGVTVPGALTCGALTATTLVGCSFGLTDSLYLGAVTTPTAGGQHTAVGVQANASHGSGSTSAFGHRSAATNWGAAAIGAWCIASGEKATAIGGNNGSTAGAARAEGANSVAVGAGARATASGGIQIGAGTNTTPDTCKIGGGTIPLLCGPTTATAAAITDVPLTLNLAAGQTASAVQINSNGGTGGDVFEVTPNATMRMGKFKIYNTEYQALAFGANTKGWIANGTGFGFSDRYTMMLGPVDVSSLSGYAVSFAGHQKLSMVTRNSDAVFELCLGNGYPSGTTDVHLSQALPANADLTGTAGRGTNISGGELRIGGGRSTGSADGGALRLCHSPAGAAGATRNVWVDQVVIDGTGVAVDAPATFTAQGITDVPATFKGSVGHTAPLTEWQDNGGNKLLQVLSDGRIKDDGNAAGVELEGSVAGGSNAAASFNQNGYAYARAGGFGLLLASGKGLSWGTAAWNPVHSSIDTGVIRDSAGVLAITNGTAGQYRSLKALLATFTDGIVTRSGASDPTVLDLTENSTTTWKNTTSGEVRHWINDGGVMKSTVSESDVTAHEAALSITQSQVSDYDTDTAKTDVAQNWTAPQTAPADTITYAGTIADDADNGSLNQIVTLTGDVTAWTVTGGSDYQVRHWWIKQDGSGGHTVTFSGIGGTEPTLSTTADEVTRVTVIKDPVDGWRWI